MIVKAKLDLDVDPKDLAASLATSPEAFARFWFAFWELTDDRRGKAIDLEPFGKAMAEQIGNARQNPFIAINDYMRYYNRKEGNP